MPLSRALKVGSTIPVTGSSLTRPRRVTPFTAENLPPTYSDVPSVASASTSPSTEMLNGVTAPSDMLKPYRFLRA